MLRYREYYSYDYSNEGEVMPTGDYFPIPVYNYYYEKTFPEFKKSEQTAHRCPVCNGTGQVVGNFYNVYNTSTTTISSCQCRSCSGTGVVWSPV